MNLLFQDDDVELHYLLQYRTAEQELKEQLQIHHPPKWLVNNRISIPRETISHLSDTLTCINSTFCLFFYKREGRCSILVHHC